MVVKNKRRDRVKNSWRSTLMIGIALCLCGCAATELEERCFPIVTLVGYEDNKVAYTLGFPDEAVSEEGKTTPSEIQVPPVKKKEFEESKAEYESHLNKQVDYNHLKVIVLEEDLMEQMSKYDAMLDYLAMSEEYPRNTYVCAVDDIDDLLEIESKLPQELGSYLEEYLNNHDTGKGEMLTLGDLIDEKENKKLVLYMPYLEVEDTYVQWGGYYAIGKGMPPVKFQ